MAIHLQLTFLVTTALAISALEQKSKTCEVSRIKTQSNFNLSQFMGEWHVISDKEIFPHQHKLDKVINVFTNIRIYGVLKDSHQVELTVVSRILGICSTSKLIAERSDFKQPAKLDVSGPNAWWPHLRNVHPAWVIWTDGDAALLCSCGKYLEDGSCNPHHTYSWTLNRDPDGHTEQQQTQIDAKITQLCMDPADFKDMKRSWPCPDFDTDALEDDDDDDDDDEDDDDEDNNPGYDKTIGDEGEDDDDEDSNPGGDETVGDGTEDNPNEEEEQAEDEVADADQEEDLTTQDDEVGVETENEPGEEEDEDIGGETEGEETEGEAGQEDEKTEL